MKHMIAAILIGASATVGAVLIDNHTGRAAILIAVAVAVYLLHKLEAEDRTGRTPGRF